MRILMIGGTGFLGYFTCRNLVAAGHEVMAVGLSEPGPGTMPDGVISIVCDTDRSPDDHLAALMRGVDCVIHAAGADGRFSAKAPAIEAFRDRNVRPVERLLPVMSRAGARNLVIFGSYYTALARERPGLIALERNPYPLSRQEQMDRAFAMAGTSIAVNVLELPYIFGGAPGRGTLWGFTMDKVRAPGPVTTPGGRTACITADQVARAAVGAVAITEGRSAWPLCGANLSYREIYGLFAQAMDVSPAFVAADLAEETAAAERQRQRLADEGVETGYDPVDVARWQEADLGLAPDRAMQALGYGHDDLAAAIRATVTATMTYGGQGPASRRQT